MLNIDDLFGRQFDREIIVLCVRWYLRYKLSFRDLVEMMAERGLSLAHTTIMRWIQLCSAPIRMGVVILVVAWEFRCHGLHWVCAVKRRRFPVGASPTRQPLQPEATGAVMEVTKWLKPSV
jgi:hypothetical protein